MIMLPEPVYGLPRNIYKLDPVLFHSMEIILKSWWFGFESKNNETILYCEGPQCEGPQCEGPQCEGPQCEGYELFLKGSRRIQLLT